MENVNNPIGALIEKKAILDSLISNGLAVPVYIQEENRVRVSESRPPGENYTEYRKDSIENKYLIAVVIQISDDMVIASNYENLQMQVIQISEVSLKKESDFHTKIVGGEMFIDSRHKQKISTPLAMFQFAVMDFSSKIVADSADDPDKVVQKLTEGMGWLKQKQETQLQNRTKTASQFNNIIKNFLNPQQRVD